MKIETIETCGFYPAMKAIHLPLGKPAISYRKENNDYIGMSEDDGYLMHCNHEDVIKRKDIELAQRLIKSGDEHAKVLRGIVVWAEITAPIYFWNEMVTYRDVVIFIKKYFLKALGHF